jgi:hypothetical protein
MDMLMKVSMTFERCLVALRTTHGEYVLSIEAIKCQK